MTMFKGKIYFLKAYNSNRLDVRVADQNSDPRIASSLSVGVREIAAWLSDDVNSCLSAIEWVKRLECLDSAEAKGYLGTGNAHSVGVVKDYVFIECEFVEDFKVLLRRECIVSMLKSYINAHEEYAGNVCVDVSVEMEGDQALSRYLELGGRLGLSDPEIAENTRKVKSSRAKKTGKSQRR